MTLSPGLAANLDRICDQAPTDDRLDVALALAAQLAAGLNGVLIEDDDGKPSEHLYEMADTLFEILAELVEERDR